MHGLVSWGTRPGTFHLLSPDLAIDTVQLLSLRAHLLARSGYVALTRDRCPTRRSLAPGYGLPLFGGALAESL